MKRLLSSIYCMVLAGVALSPPAVAGFDAPSSFPANPAAGTGRFGFDLEMQVDLESRRSSGQFIALVNSHDGSMALENAHTALWALGMKDIPALQVHHVIYRKGSLMACGQHPKFGKGCIALGFDQEWQPVAAQLQASHVAHFFRSARATEQSRAPCCPNGTRGLAHLTGQGADGSWLTFWFDPGTATTATLVPFLGPGVGIMKDEISSTNRVVRHMQAQLSGSADNVEMHLMKLSRVNRSIDLSSYRLVTAFSTGGLNNARDVSNAIMGQGRQIRAWSKALASCDKGTAGRDCRALYRGKIRAAEEDMKRRAFEFATKHGLPTPGD